MRGTAYMIGAVGRILDHGGKVVLIRDQHVTAVLRELTRKRVFKEPLYSEERQLHSKQFFNFKTVILTDNVFRQNEPLRAGIQADASRLQVFTKVKRSLTEEEVPQTGANLHMRCTASSHSVYICHISDTPVSFAIAAR
jgi:hypothetical protein